MARKRFFRHFPRKGYPLYWILIAYLIVGYFYPVVGLLALICMIAPVSFAVKRGRWWCGNACPRGSLYDRVLSKYSPHRPIPEFVRTRGFRIFMVLFIFDVRLTDVWSLGRLECRRTCVLEHHPRNDHSGRNPFVHICSAHMVFILSDGDIIGMGHTAQRAPAQKLHADIRG